MDKNLWSSEIRLENDMIMKDKYDVAINMAWKKFEELHPKKDRPEWLEKCISISGNKNQNKNWVVTMILLSKTQLKPNQYWESVNNDTRLIEIDEVTGEHFVVICGGPPEDIHIIFEAEIDTIKNFVKVLVDLDLSILDKTKYEIIR